MLTDFDAPEKKRAPLTSTVGGALTILHSTFQVDQSLFSQCSISCCIAAVLRSFIHHFLCRVVPRSDGVRSMSERKPYRTLFGYESSHKRGLPGGHVPALTARAYISGINHFLTMRMGVCSLTTSIYMPGARVETSTLWV